MIDFGQQHICENGLLAALEDFSINAHTVIPEANIFERIFLFSVTFTCIKIHKQPDYVYILQRFGFSVN